ncbi:hypothetical protein D3C71_1618050 [compost metagenome]
MQVQLLFVAATAQKPGTGRLGVFQRFQGYKSLAGNDKQRSFGIQASGQFMEFTTIDIRQVMAAHPRGVAVW